MVDKKERVSMVTSKQSESRIQVLEDGVSHNSRPIIVMNREKIYNKLIEAKIMNTKKNPCCKANIATVSDYNIVVYFNGVANGLLSYYRCADDFYKMKSIINWFIRYSAISTIKYKHKLASRKAVLEKYGNNLTFSNHKGQIVSLISKEYVMGLKKEYLISPEVE